LEAQAPSASSQDVYALKQSCKSTSLSLGFPFPILNQEREREREKQGIINTLALPIDKMMLYIYLLCPHSEHQKNLFQSK
jgi:hypothetical protein